MTEPAPLASVVIATHNGRDFIAETLESVLSQTCSDLEIIVCDDGSTDDTRRVLDLYARRITLLEQENHGVSHARNRAAERGRGRFVAFLDQDDLWEPDMLERQVEGLRRRPACGLIYSDSWIIDRYGVVHGRRSRFLDFVSGDVRTDLLRGNFVPLETAVMPMAVFRACGGFDESLHYLEDYELYLRIASRHSVAFQPGPLSRYRIHERNLSHQREALLREWVTVLDRLLEDPERPPAERALIEAQIAMRSGEVAWQAIKRGDLPAADRWIARAGSLCPAGLHLRLVFWAWLLRTLPAPLAERTCRLLPRLRLYGVS